MAGQPPPIHFGNAGLYPSSSSPDHVSLVYPQYGEHARANFDHYQYGGIGGGVVYAQRMPQDAQRALTHSAYADMRERVALGEIPTRRTPGAMGSLLADGSIANEAGVRREGYKFLLGSSIRKRNQDVLGPARLEASLDADVRMNHDGVLPPHFNDYKCAELGLLSEHRYANSGFVGPARLAQQARDDDPNDAADADAWDDADITDDTGIDNYGDGEDEDVALCSSHDLHHEQEGGNLHFDDSETMYQEAGDVDDEDSWYDADDGHYGAVYIVGSQGYKAPCHGSDVQIGCETLCDDLWVADLGP